MSKVNKTLIGIMALSVFVIITSWIILQQMNAVLITIFGSFGIVVCVILREVTKPISDSAMGKKPNV